LSGCSCYVETNRERSLAISRNAGIKTLLLAMDRYRSRSGRLPSSLEELRKSRTDVPEVDRMVLTHYSYHPDGFVVGDGTRWLVSTPDPYNKGHLIVGKLPIEVDSKKK
jgi:hypothetical protein